MNKIEYWVMDIRATDDINEADVLSWHDSYQQAIKYTRGCDEDTCIVRVTNDDQKLVYCSLVQEG